MIIYGINPIKEFVKNTPKNIEKLYYTGSRLNDIQSDLKNIHTQKVSQKQLNEITGNSENQGIAILIRKPRMFDYNDLKNNIKKMSNMIVMLDHVKDPHNLGAIVRTGLFFGINSFVIPNRRSASFTVGAVKSSTGHIFQSMIYEVPNLINTIKFLKNNDYWIFGADIEGENLLSDKFNKFKNDKIVLILGSEQNGLSEAMKKNCDFLLSIRGNKNVNSLNVSVAAGILINKFISYD